MSTTTGLTKTGPTPFRNVEHRVRFTGLLRSEWIKFGSVRSVVGTVLAAFVAVVAVGVLLTLGLRSTLADPENAAALASQGLDATAASLQGAQLASLVVAALGVLVVAGEFSTGMIRTSFVTAPGRLGVIAAKAVVLAVVVALVLGAAVFAAFFAGQAILGTRGVEASITDPGVLRAVVGNVVLLVGVALAGLGLGTLMRNSAAAICTVLAALFVVPLLLGLWPESWGGPTVREYYFANTTSNLVSVSSQAEYLSIGAGLVAFAVWIAVLLGLGALSAKGRDV